MRSKRLYDTPASARILKKMSPSMKYFTLDELTRSATATRLGIDNTPPPEALGRLRVLTDRLLDPIRQAWGAPIRVNSGYRCPALNRAVGGSSASAHLRGEAADITTGTRAGNRRLFEMIRDGSFDFDRMIWEQGSSEGPDWIHISFAAERMNRRCTTVLGITDKKRGNR